ncbi:MAG: ABC transporter substrate-binding protein [Pseudomonadota bacterium]
MSRRTFLKKSGALMAAPLLVDLLAMDSAFAQGTKSMIRILAEAGPNTLDPAGSGFNRYSINVTWNVYDRLVTFGSKKLEDGTEMYDYYKVVPQLAESFSVSPDGKTITFVLRKNAVFHDGTPITSADVKWSLDRALAMPASRSQLATGSMTKPEQFVVVDDHTLRVVTEQADRFTLPNLAVLFPAIINSKLAKANATAADPWAADWLKSNTAASGPFQVESYKVGQEIIFKRFDKWTGGKLPAVDRIIYQVVPAGASRRAAAERGSADIVLDLPPRDVSNMLAGKKVKISGVPWTNGFQFLGMNNQMKPFDNINVRRAIAHAVPYQAMFDNVIYKRGLPLYGGKEQEAKTTQWPTPLPYDTDLAKAKRYLAEAGMADGFETTFSFDMAQAATAEPIAVLLQESLAKIGIKVNINKVPSGQLGSMLQNKELAFFFEQSGAWLNDPDYFFRVFYQGDSRWNYGSYKNPEMIEAVKQARFEGDKAKYEALVKKMITLAMTEVPIVLLWSPFLDVAFGPKLGGYEYMYHRQLEFRPLTNG